MAQSLPDLVRDSRLDVRVYDGYCLQTDYVSNQSLRQRRVRVEQKWETTEQLGRGSFGVVRKERCASGPAAGQLRAVKEIWKAGPSGGQQMDCYRELEAIAKFSQEKYRDCFVRSLGWYETTNSIFIAMEYLPLGDLRGYITVALGETAARGIIHQVLEGIVFMHDNQFAHRDLKPGNILVLQEGPDWWVKIADFGISKRIESTALHTIVGTRPYLAPEVIGLDVDTGTSAGANFTLAVDIWAIGTIAFQIITGRLAFASITHLVDYVRGSPAPTADSSSVECADFLRLTMAASPRQRPRSQQLINHAWLASATGASLDNRPQTLSPGQATAESPNDDSFNSIVGQTMKSPPSPIWSESSDRWTTGDSWQIANSVARLTLGPGLEGASSNQSPQPAPAAPRDREARPSATKGKEISLPAAEFRPMAELRIRGLEDVFVAVDPGGKRIATWSMKAGMVPIYARNGNAWERQSTVQWFGYFTPWTLTFTPEGDILMAGSGNRFTDIEVRFTGDHYVAQRQDVQITMPDPVGLRISPDGTKLAIFDQSSAIQICHRNLRNKRWDMALIIAVAGPGAVIPVKSPRYLQQSFSQDGRHLVTGNGIAPCVRFWSLQDHTNKWELLQELTIQPLHLCSMTLSSSGRLLAVAFKEEKIGIYRRSANGQWSQTYMTDRLATSVCTLDFSSCDTMLATGAFADRSVSIWGVEPDGTWVIRQKLTSHLSGTNSVRFSSDGTQVASGGCDDGELRIWTTAEIERE